MALPARNRAAETANFALVMAFSWLYLTPLLVFWTTAAGWNRPAGASSSGAAPSWPAFLAGLSLCFVPFLLPPSWFRSWEGPRALKLFRALGVGSFKRYATNGDLVNRLARRTDGGYRMVRDLPTARDWAEQARGAERNHLVFLLMGTFSALYAAAVGWYGWAVGLSASNVAFNVYPILLQRYNRARVERLERRCAHLPAGSRSLPRLSEARP
jgi:hypothetical protein